MRYNCILLDETRCEFCVEIEANTKQEADAACEDMYPESSVVEILSPQDQSDREVALYSSAQRMYDEDYYYDN